MVEVDVTPVRLVRGGEKKTGETAAQTMNPVWSNSINFQCQIP